LRNDVVFSGASPRIDQALILVQNDADLWMLAGAKGLTGLVAARPQVSSVWWWVVVSCLAWVRFCSTTHKRTAH